MMPHFDAMSFASAAAKRFVVIESWRRQVVEQSVLSFGVAAL
jgi:hypothetical protein